MRPHSIFLGLGVLFVLGVIVYIGFRAGLAIARAWGVGG